jgi:hypothetical protein
MGAHEKSSNVNPEVDKVTTASQAYQVEEL